jgi:hypothetical protein
MNSTNYILTVWNKDKTSNVFYSDLGPVGLGVINVVSKKDGGIV